jgi:hypothetical protein
MAGVKKATEAEIATIIGPGKARLVANWHSWPTSASGV